MKEAEPMSFLLGALRVYIGSSFHKPLADRPPRRHTHPCHELVCVDLGEGKMSFTVNPPLVEHISAEAEPESVSSLLFEVDREEGGILSLLAVSESTEIIDRYGGAMRISSLKSLFLETSRGAREHIAAELQLLFVGLARSLAYGEKTEAPRDTEKKSRLTYLEEYFNIHLADPNSSKSDLARELGVSERQLTRILLETYGSNFSAIMQKSRMTLAEAMLGEGGRSLGEVASAVGYFTEESFAKAYRKYYGKSPKKDIGGKKPS